MSDNDSEPQATPEAAIDPGTPITPVTPINPIQPIAPGDGPVQLSSASPSTTTTTPSVEVTVPNTGTVQFSLVVTDNLGQSSPASFATVTIQGGPTAVLTAAPQTVNDGGTITLTATDVSTTGSIAKYVFSLVPAPS
jgi:hypothetical protein